MPMTDLENEVKPFAKGEIFIEKDNFKALEKSMELYEEGDLIVFAGSLYLIGNIKREYLDRIAK